MPNQYKEQSTIRYERAYKSEANYSKKRYGLPHATQYFSEVRAHMDMLVRNPHITSSRGKKGEYRISNVIKGIHILYHVNEEKKVVTFLDIGGDNRLHEMQKEAKTRKTRPPVNLAVTENKTKTPALKGKIILPPLTARQGR